MMKFIFMTLFLIPLCFLNYWVIFLFLSLLFCLFFISYSFDSQFFNISYFFGCDHLSFLMVLLSIYICMLMLLASEKIYFSKNYYNFFSLVILVLMFSLLGVFISLNFFLFYLFFEVSLVPTLFLILGWGYQPERIQAGVYLLFYTIFASLPMLVCLFFMYENIGSLFLYFFSFYSYTYIYFFFIMAVFLVKIPMFMLHLWLPKAHVEAPVSGSMILAGVMLKLGGYGIMRVIPMFLEIVSSIGYLFISISLFGGFVVSLICLRQSDMKSLIAYSSVSHMGLMVGGMMTLSYWGFVGSLMLMIAHGLCSSGLFCLANISYERLSSRSLYINKGLINIMPSLSLCWFLLCSSNMAAPPSFNLISEIFLINSMVYWSTFSMVGLMLISFFSAAYSLYLYSITQHGKYYSGLYSFSSGLMREYILLFMHWLPLNLLILKSDYFSLWV